jgi:Fe2+ or Zn2+ uptake regulation protein
MALPATRRASRSERVQRALKNEGPARGQLEVARRILPDGAALPEYQTVYDALRVLVRAGVVHEKRDDECGAPSYVYSIPMKGNKT